MQNIIIIQQLLSLFNFCDVTKLTCLVYVQPTLCSVSNTHTHTQVDIGYIIASFAKMWALTLIHTFVTEV